MIAPAPDNEAHRLEALRQYAVLDTPPEEAFDDLTQLAAQICGTPIALVSLVDAHRQWFKSKVGIETPETPRDIAFCAHAIHQSDLVVVPDAAQDTRFSDNPMVTTDPHIRFYAGMPLVAPSGHAVGTLCVIDREPRHLTPSQYEALRQLGRQVVRLLESRRQTSDASESMERIRQSEERFQLAAQGSRDALWEWQIPTNTLYLSPRWKEMRGYTNEDLSASLDVWTSHLHPDDKDRVLERVSAYLARRIPVFSEEYRTRCKDGSYRWVLDQGQAIWDNQGRPLRMAGSETDITAQKETAAVHQREQQRTEIIASIEARALTSGRTADVFSVLLDEILRLTASEYGFIGEVLAKENGTPYLRTHALTDIAWDDATRASYAQQAPSFEFSNPQTLVGQVLRTRDTVIANDPTSDSRRGVFPPGHPPLHTFLGLPIFHRTAMIGMIGLANRPGGYDAELVVYLQPVLATCAKILDRHNAEQARLATEERLQLVIRGTNDGIWDWNLLTHALYTSPRWKELLGYQEHEVANYDRAFFDLLHPDDEQPMNEALQRHLQNQAPFHLEIRMRHKDGLYRWVLTRGEAVRNEQGEPVRIVGSLIDIHARRQGEETAKTTQALLTSILDHVPDTIVVKNAADLRIVHFNKSGETLTGLHRQDLIGKTSADLFPKDDADFYTATDREVLANGQPLDIPNEPLHTRHKGVRRLHTIKIPIADPHGMPQYLLGISEDITEREDLNALDSTHNRILSLLTTMPSWADAQAAVLQAVGQVFHGIIALYWEPSPTHMGLACRTVWMAEDATASTFASLSRTMVFPRGVGLPGRAWESGTVHWLEDITEDVNFPRRSAAAQAQLRTAIAFPIVADGQSEGVIEILTPQQLAPHKHRLAMLQSLGAAVGQWVAHRRSQDHQERLSRYSQMILSSVGDGIFGLDSNGALTFLNPTAAAMLGYAAAELMGIPLHAVIHHTKPDGSVHPIDECPMTQCLAQGTTQTITDDIFWRRDGQCVPVNYTSTPILNETGAVTGAVICFRDITAQKEGEAALRRQQALLKDRLKEMHCLYRLGMLRADPALNVDQFIQAAVTLLPPAFQYPEITVARVTVADRIYESGVFPEDAKILAAPIRLNGHSAGLIEVGYAEDRPTEAEGPFLHEERSLLDAVASRVGEALEHKKLEQDRHQLLTVLNASLNEIYMFRADTLRFTYANRGALDNLGYSLDAMQTMTPVDIKPEMAEATFRNLITPLLNGTQPLLIFQTRHQRRDGSTYPVEVHLQVMGQDDGWTFLALTHDITKRIETEATLQEQEHRLRAIVDHAVDGIITIDEQGLIESFNPAAERLFGYPAAEILGQNITQLIPELYQSERDGSLANQWRTGQAKTIGIGREAIGRRKDGTTFPLELAVSEMCLGNRRLFTGLIRDITERRQAEEQFRRVVESAPNGLLIADDTGTITLVNPQLERQFGYARTELLGQAIEILIPERFRSQHQDLRAAFFAEPSTRTIGADRELYGCRKDGTEFPVEIGLNPLDTPHGMHVLASVVDITARKQAEAQQREQAQRLRAIVDHAVDGIITIDEHGMIESFNLAAERLFGFSPVEVVGQNVRILMPEPYRSEHDSYMANYKRTNQAKIIGKWREAVGCRKDGTVFPIELSVGEVRLKDRLLFTGIIHDITERKAVESQLERASQEMARHNRELAEAHDHAVRATQAKSEFLAGMSHEIRTPMNAIIGMAEILQETILTDEQHNYINRVNRAANALLALINDILDISKIEAGRLELESIPFDLLELVETTGELMAVRANAKQLELIIHIDNGTPQCVLGDSARLRQVLINLLGNAIKFTERGEVVVHIHRDEADPALLHLSVTDTGIGIPENKLETIFESFTQVDSSTTRQYGGTGLGLSICQRLVTMMGGRIWATSQVGLGTTIHLTVRLRETAAPSSSPAKTPPPLTGRQILLVDDNETSRQVLRKMLAQAGATLMEAGSGPDALTLLRDFHHKAIPIHLVIMDDRMPGMDGFAVIEAMRTSPDLATAPVIMLTSDLRHKEAACVEELGVLKSLNKPVRRSALLAAVESALFGQRQAVSDHSLPSVHQPNSADTPPPSAGGRILLVEDLEDNRDVVTLFLKGSGYDLTYAENGAIAVTRFQASPFDLVLMDMQMPVMDGLTAAKTIRAWEQAHQRTPTPIIALTAHAFQEDIEKSLAAGCSAHLTKPIKKKTLLETIRQYAAARQDRRAA